MLRGSGDAKIDKMIALWLLVDKIDFEPHAKGHQSRMTGFPDLYNPGMIAGPSWMASKDSTKNYTQLPQLAIRTNTVESQLVLRMKGMTNKDTPSPQGTKKYRDTL